MNLSYLYLKKILEEELRDHDCQCQLNPDFTVTISCRVGGRGHAEIRGKFTHFPSIHMINITILKNHMGIAMRRF